MMDEIPLLVTRKFLLYLNVAILQIPVIQQNQRKKTKIMIFKMIYKKYTAEISKVMSQILSNFHQ